MVYRCYGQFSGYVLCAWMGNENNARQDYNATAAVYQKVVTLEDKLAEKPVTGKSRKTDALRLSNVSRPAKGFRVPFTVFMSDSSELPKNISP